MSSNAAPGSASKPGWFASEGWRWLIVTILIPAAGFGWDRLQERQLKREKELDTNRARQQQLFEERRNQSELVIKLLPSLSADPGSPQRSVALAVLSDLAQRGAGVDSLFTVVNLAVQESDRRVRSGQASDSERATLTHIAAARDERMSDADRTPPVAEPDTKPAIVAPGNASQPPIINPEITQTAKAKRSYTITTPRLYVHVFDDSQRADADKLRNLYATERRWLAPAVEKVVRIALSRGTAAPPGSKSVRVVYFSSDDEAKAKDVVAWLRANGQPDAIAELSTVKAPAGQIEVWYPKE